MICHLTSSLPKCNSKNVLCTPQVTVVFMLLVEAAR